MTKQSTGSRESVDSLIEQLESMEGRAQAAIDALIEEKNAARSAFAANVIHLDDQIKRLDEVYKAASGRYYVGTGNKEKTDQAPRQRRSKEEMQAEAKDIIAFVANSGKDGVKGGQIRAQFPKVGTNIVKFLEANGGVRLTTTGHKSLTKYFVQQ
jgi:hypothetical protein